MLQRNTEHVLLIDYLCCIWFHVWTEVLSKAEAIDANVLAVIEITDDAKSSHHEFEIRLMPFVIVLEVENFTKLFLFIGHYLAWVRCLKYCVHVL